MIYFGIIVLYSRCSDIHSADPANSNQAASRYSAAGQGRDWIASAHFSRIGLACLKVPQVCFGAADTAPIVAEFGDLDCLHPFLGLHLPLLRHLVPLKH